MKRQIIIALLIGLCICFSGCSNKESNTVVYSDDFVGIYNVFDDSDCYELAALVLYEKAKDECGIGVSVDIKETSVTRETENSEFNYYVEGIVSFIGLLGKPVEEYANVEFRVDIHPSAFGDISDFSGTLNKLGIK